MLSPEKINHYKLQLEKLKCELTAELEHNKTPEDFGSDVDSLEEESSETEALTNQLAENQATKERINEIDAALNRIETGTYGTCTKCGSEIGEKVLAVAPESALCEQCKKSA